MNRGAEQIQIFDFISWSGVEAELGSIKSCNKQYPNSLDSASKVSYDKTNYQTDVNYNLNFERVNADSLLTGSFTIVFLSMILFKSIL